MSLKSRAAIVILAAAATLPASRVAAQPARKAVLILHIEQPHVPWVAALSSSIFSALEAAPASIRPDILTEYLDTEVKRTGAAAEVAWFRERYRAQSFDAIIAVTKGALDFVVPLRDELWPSVPIILLAPRRSLEGFQAPAGVIVVPARFEIERTLDLAKRLFPDTRHVAYVYEDASKSERLRRDLDERGMDLVDLTGLTMEVLQKRIAALPTETIVFFESFREDAGGRRFVPREALRMIAPLSNRPIFGVSDTLMGYGVLGGWVLDYRQAGAEAARVALEVLAGEPAAKLPIRSDFSRLQLDGRELARWGVPDSRLPDGGEVLFREPTLWRQYPRTIVAVLGALLFQAILIVALLVERRRRAEARALAGAAFASLPGQVAVLDGRATVVEVNENWSAFGRSNGAGPAGGVSVGASYLDVWLPALRSGEPVAEEAIELVGSVLAGSRRHGSIEYHWRNRDADLWSEIHVQALEGRRGGAVVTALDVTLRHQADAEARRHREEVAHSNRVASLGELASSLAHELNQPLTAILTNAQAARRILNGGSPDLAEVRDSLNDIIEDDQRAGEVIQRLRALLRKEKTHRGPVDLNEEVRKVLRLVASDAQLRKVQIELDFAPALPAISGDSVQILQVILNLVVNGLDAVAERPVGERRIAIRTALLDGTVEVDVSDSGPGIADRDLPKLFEPFFTTKAQGLGMGLSICRSIVEAHAGRITAESGPGRGATFRCIFPAGQEGAA